MINEKSKITSPNLIKRLFKHEVVKVACIYAGVLAIIFASVVFCGHTLLSTTYTSKGITESGTYSYDGQVPINVFNIDLGTPAHFELSVNPAVGEQIRQLEIPLWNPYQASGTPLAAQYSTRALFPYQIIEDISPVWMWDFFILGRLWIAGIFTYFFLRSLRFRPNHALLGGLLYMVSGTFTWFINLEQYVNTAMMIPILCWAVEKYISQRQGRYFICLVFSAALLLFAGNPEVALYALLLAAGYAVFRVYSIKGLSWSAVSGIGIVALGFILGAGISAPLLVPFQELVANSFHTHEAGVGIGIADPAPVSWMIGLILPNFFNVPSAERILPINGVWDFLGGYTGILSIVLITTGAFLRSRYRGLLIFFGIFGTCILLKNFGIPPFIWLGKLPLLDQVWSNRWAGPIWTFSFAIAAASGFAAIESYRLRAAIKKWDWKNPLIIVCCAAVVTGLISWWLTTEQAWNLYVQMIPERHYLMVPTSRDYMVASTQSGIIVAIALITSAIMIWRGTVTARGRQYSLLLLVAVSLWFYIPKGEEYPYIYLNMIPVGFGIAAAWVVSLPKNRLAVGILIVAILSSLGISCTSTYGFPERQDPFNPAPYVTYVKENAGLSRVMAIEGVLMPNMSSAVGIYDVRYVNSLNIAAYQNYMLHLRGLLPQTRELPPSGGSDLWFTGMAPFSYIQGMEVSLAPAIEEKLPYYSLLGVKYFITPKATTLNNLALVYNEEVKIYENPSVMPRAFIAYQVERAFSYEQAQNQIGTEGFSWESVMMLEESVPGKSQRLSGGEISEAEIISYSPNRVTIKAQARSAGILVLSDVFYPGWRAYLDGNRVEIYRVNGIMRGLFIEEGEHIVEFQYYADSFRQGIAIALCSFILMMVVVFINWKREKYASIISLENWRWWK